MELYRAYRDDNFQLIRELIDQGADVNILPENECDSLLLLAAYDHNLDAVKNAANEILGKTLITPQTGDKGKKVQRIYIENGCNIDKEFYFSILVDRSEGCISIIASSEGGMNIEEVAEKTPEKIIKLSVDPILGFMPFHSRILANGLGLKGAVSKEAFGLFSKLFKTFVGFLLTLDSTNFCKSLESCFISLEVFTSLYIFIRCCSNLIEKLLLSIINILLL